MRRPAFQFYPADWRNDTSLQFCSLSARGLWIEMMCIAHDCVPYGYLRINGKPMTPAQIGRLVGISERECTKLLDELFEAGVPSRAEDGAIYSRRMVRDEQLRAIRAEGGKGGAEHGSKGGIHGAKGGRPRKEITPQETPLSEDARGVIKPSIKPPPSSSSSSSSSVNQKSVNPSLAFPSSNEGTPGGRVCERLHRDARMPDANPQHPKLLALLAAGLSEDEIVSAGIEAVARGKGFAYAMATAEGRRREAANVTTLPDAASFGRLTKAGQRTVEAAARWLESERATG